MHEMSLCQSILQTLEEQARVQDYRRVTEIRLEIGALAGVEIAALRFGFEVVMRGTLAEGARLQIVEVPAQARCPLCARPVAVQRRYDACPHCGHFPLPLERGDEMRILDLEVQ